LSRHSVAFLGQIRHIWVALFDQRSSLSDDALTRAIGERG